MSDKQEKEMPVLDDSVVGFRLQQKDDTSKDVEIIAKKDQNGDYPVVTFNFMVGEEAQSFSLSRDELSAVVFSISREDQQSKLLDSRFREYKEVPVRLVVEAKKDIRKGEMVIVYRKEKVPIEFEYNREKVKDVYSFN